MAYSIFSHSGYITDSLDISFDFIRILNPNTASYEALSQIPFLSDREIGLIMIERKKKPFKSIEDLSNRIGLLPFETAYLSNVFYFNHTHTLYASLTIDTSVSYRVSVFLKDMPMASIWKYENKTLFMNAVHTRYFSIYQGYIFPVFRGGLTEYYGVIRRKDGLKRDTTYNFGLTAKHFLLFHTPHKNLFKIYYGPFALMFINGTSSIKSAYTFSLAHKGLYIEAGQFNNHPVFYFSTGENRGRNTTFFDIYSKYTDYRIYGGHIYSRYTISKYTSIKTYASYKHTYRGFMRFSTTLHFHLLQKHAFFNIGLKKTYYDKTRIYLSTGKYGRNYTYFSIVKTIGSPSYLLRYSMGIYGLSISYIISQGDEEYIFLDDVKDGYFLGSIKNRLKIGYRFSYKGFRIATYYIKNADQNLLRLRIQGRLSY